MVKLPILNTNLKRYKYINLMIINIPVSETVMKFKLKVIILILV